MVLLYSIYLYLPFTFSDNYIDGKEFLKLTEQDIKEMIPAVGIIKKLARLIPKVCTGYTQCIV